jgi:hypothetical protein
MRLRTKSSHDIIDLVKVDATFVGRLEDIFRAFAAFGAVKNWTDERAVLGVVGIPIIS